MIKFITVGHGKVVDMNTIKEVAIEITLAETLKIALSKA